ncbi:MULTISPECIES: DUF4440 domain-containing protein [Marinobacter]|uniref:nuclear transport factor 2 family protein n=1 Tax=Marinobacter TaxID=2742 RepID=UPI003B43B476
MDELEQLERELHSAGTRQSAARLRELLRSDFREIGRSGREYSRHTILERLVDAEPPKVHAENFQRMDLDPGVALVTYRSAHIDSEGRLHRDSLRSSIWIRGEEGWQMVFHQGTPIERAPDESA